MHQGENSLNRSYNRAEAIIVYKTKDHFGGLSNMASGYPLLVNGVHILTAEALYQACRFPLSPQLQREIIGEYSPMTAKMKSKPSAHLTRADWSSVRYKIMRWCLRVKLAQNYGSFGDLLLATKSLPIVELSKKDDYWGAKPSNANDAILIGQNVLGRLLMELRELLRADSKEMLKTVTPPNISDFFLIGKPIGQVTAEQVNKFTSQSPLF